MTLRKSPDNIHIEISVEFPKWQDNFPEYQDHITACFDLIVAHVPETQNFSKFSHLELSILLGDDDNIKQLNFDHRKQNKPTNVLSFPCLSDEEIDLYLKRGKDIPDYPVALGDVVFAFETIEREAKSQGKRFSDHFCHLSLHGILHLLGYDHIEDNEAEIMENLERELLQKLSIDDPYQD
ncbi:MAG: rRNA maturation RNase YbeY [Emcibacter sp.]|nr:rRNA maturation RNase YbeY [Emcibacter sp.]